MRVDAITIEWTDDPVQPRPSYHCSAVARVSYSLGKQYGRRLEWLTSGGLSGIDAQSAPDYKRDIVREELGDLRDHLRRFGIRVSDRQWLRLLTPDTWRTP